MLRISRCTLSPGESVDLARSAPGSAHPDGPPADGRVHVRAPGGPWRPSPVPTLKLALARLLAASSAVDAMTILEAGPAAGGPETTPTPAL